MTEQTRATIELLQMSSGYKSTPRPKRQSYPVNIDKPEDTTPRRSPTLDLLVGEGKLMWRECAWCHAFLGYTAGNDEPNKTTHEACKPCSKTLKG